MFKITKHYKTVRGFFYLNGEYEPEAFHAENYTEILRADM